jgi:hypothetical protein
MRRLKFLMPIGFLAVAAGFAAVVMLLWNWLMPMMFGLAVISFWQALGLLVLCRILFGGFGWGHRGKKHEHRPNGHPIFNKWKEMTPEQRKEFLNRRRGCFGRGEFFGEDADFEENKPKEQD